MIRAEIAQYTFPTNLELTNDSIQLSGTLLAKADQVGFYVLSEQQDLAQASLLIRALRESLLRVSTRILTLT